MPRQGRRGSAAPARSAPSRPTPAPARTNVTPPQPPSRSATTAAHPPTTTAQPPQAGSQGSGLFGQMASTAAGVAVGSSIGHAIGGFFGGGSSQPQVETQQNEATVASQAANGSYQSNNFSRSCEPDAKAFTRCLDENKGDYQMSVCGWYLEQLKACQSAASQY